MILTDGFLLLLCHVQGTGCAVSNAHSLTEWTQLRVILFVLPNVQEWFAVLELQIIVFGETG